MPIIEPLVDKLVAPVYKAICSPQVADNGSFPKKKKSYKKGNMFLLTTTGDT